jgi:hypothetical protein
MLAKNQKQYYPLVHEHTQTTLVLDFDQFLTAIGWKRNLFKVSSFEIGKAVYVELHVW